MDKKVLTINDITKICDDNLYFSPDNKLTQFQWYDFQLEFALKNLDPNLEEYLVHKLTNYKRTRSELLEVIYQIYGTNKIYTKPGIKSEILKKYGLLKGEGIKDYYLPQTLGGISELIYDSKTNKVEIPEIYEKVTNGNISEAISDLSSSINISSKTKVKKTKRIIPKRKLTKKATSSQASKKSSSSSQASKKSKRRIIPNLNKIDPVRKAKGLRVIEDSDNRCRRLGKFDWNRNSCYADSVFLGVLYNAILNKPDHLNPIGSLIYDTIMNKSYTIENIGTEIPNCVGKTREETVVILNDILLTLKDILTKIESGHIINIRGFTLKVKNTCDNLFTENFHDGGTHDSKDFYNNIMLILGLESSNFNKYKLYNFNYENTLNLLDESYVKNPYDNSPIRTQDGLGQNILGYFQENTNSAPILNIEVLSQYLYKKYSEINVDAVSTTTFNANKAKYTYNKYFNTYIPKTKVGITKLRLNTVSLDITDFLVTRHVEQFLNDDNIAYKYLDPNIDDQLYLGERYYFNSEDKGDYEKYHKSSEITSDKGFRLGMKIEELSVDNSSNYINFNINRSHRLYSIHGRILNLKLNLKINLVEEFTIEDVQYNLDFIVCHYGNHYVSIYKCGNKYYLYDDTLASNDDYVIEIGTFENLSSFKYSNKSEFALRNSVFISYSK